ncbi:MAG: VCBS repeat-containing protein [Candidatus Omnitrophica bacterium]|nr:VCBS repeat-containing protein [Candidatus Omnitrophota bacterium]MCM8793457.1 VCBS repeat-containing protein [Candidatus Omnitrophota bacterium]
MKGLRALFFLWFSLPLLALSAEDFFKIDLDNDGREEKVVVSQEFDTFSGMPPLAREGRVIVYKSEGSKDGEFSVPDHIEKVEFVDLNKDGRRQILVWTLGGAHYRSIFIYGYRNNSLYKIFHGGSASGIRVNLDSEKPTIEIARPNWGKENWSYASGEYLWEVYSWEGRGFVYNEALSSTKRK